MNVPPNPSTAAQFARYQRNRDRRDAIAHTRHKDKLSASRARKDAAIRRRRRQETAHIDALNRRIAKSPIDSTPQLRKRGE